MKTIKKLKLVLILSHLALWGLTPSVTQAADHPFPEADACIKTQFAAPSCYQLSIGIGLPVSSPEAITRELIRQQIDQFCDDISDRNQLCSDREAMTEQLYAMRLSPMAPLGLFGSSERPHPEATLTDTIEKKTSPESLTPSGEKEAPGSPTSGAHEGR